MAPQHPTTFVLIDTNVFGYLTTQGKKGFEPEHWEAVKRHVKEGRCRLLMPEVVRLELNKRWSEMPDDIQENIEDLKSKTNCKFTLNSGTEIPSPSEAVHKAIDEFGKEVLTDWTKRKDLISSWIDTESNREYLPLTSEAIFTVKRRMIEGRHPKKKASDPRDLSENDCLIMESAIRHLAIQAGSKEFLICSSDATGFGIGEALSHHYRDELPPSKIVKDLESLATFLGGKESLVPVMEETVKTSIVANAIPAIWKMTAGESGWCDQDPRLTSTTTTTTTQPPMPPSGIFLSPHQVFILKSVYQGGSYNSEFITGDLVALLSCGFITLEHTANGLVVHLTEAGLEHCKKHLSDNGGAYFSFGR